MDQDDEDDESVDREQMLGLVRTFLETHPLYAPFRFSTSFRHAGEYNRQGWEYPSNWPKALMLRCRRCQLDTTWQLVEITREDRVPFQFYKGHYLLRYMCVRCGHESSAFWCTAESDEARVEHVLRKQGQSPAWSIEPPAAISKALPSESVEFYRKGLICLNHNFGLGAVGYFRRVVEQVTHHLLNLVEENARQLGDTTTVDDVRSARNSHQATDRLKHAAGLLPSALRVGGRNPLSELYEAYSEGIHSLTDEECMDVALTVKAGLDYLLPALHEQLAAARAYQAAMSKAKRRKQ